MRLDYAFLDSGHGRKLERFGEIILTRPSASAIWAPRRPALWGSAHAIFSRVEGAGWELKRQLPEIWQTEMASMRFLLKRTDFGHLGLFPEHARFWLWMQEKWATQKKYSRFRLLNLFAYSGGASIAAARLGAEVVHVDASKGMVSWARENARLNGCEDKIAWIVEDVMKFLQRRIRRGETFDAIICDPPTFGRGAKAELFKIERDALELIDLCRALLSEEALFFLLSCHTPGFTPLLLKQLLEHRLPFAKGKIEADEMTLLGSQTFALPCGAFALWSREGL